MKALFILLITITSLSNTCVQDNITDELIFIEQVDQYLYFSNSDDESIDFLIKESELEKYDFSNEDFVGKKFKVTYETETEIDELDEEVDVRTITNIILIN